MRASSGTSAASALRALALLALAAGVRRRIVKRGGRTKPGAGAWLGALAASVGLVPFAPLAGLLNHAGAGGVSGKVRDVVELAMRPLGEWDSVLWGVGAHRWLLLASALPALALSAVAFRSGPFRSLIGGVALGSAALLMQMAWSADAAFVGGAFLARVWEIGNALVCVWLARVALDGKPGSGGGPA